MKIIKALYRLQCALEEAYSPWEATDKMSDLQILLRLDTDPTEKAALEFLRDLINNVASPIIQYRENRTDELAEVVNENERASVIRFWNSRIHAYTEVSEAAQAVTVAIYELI